MKIKNQIYDSYYYKNDICVKIDSTKKKKKKKKKKKFYTV